MMIVQLRKHYILWSNIVDAPLTVFEDETELQEYFQIEYGNQGVIGLKDRMQRIREKGTSSRIHSNAVSTIWFNRAGPKGEILTILGLYLHYCHKQPIRSDWIIPYDPDVQNLYEKVVAGWDEYCDQGHTFEDTIQEVERVSRENNS